MGEEGLKISMNVCSALLPEVASPTTRIWPPKEVIQHLVKQAGWELFKVSLER